ncbi:DNA helicase PIF1, ATP-dependent [Metarhizium guizhouense ARSEF 977]|uniref:ATP-dependent DNA helicase n=1 Tax=Metarhizium guizhouense (strain ARSEF 977) TaxID=1276136 RepID=A0A0B4H2C0_METGA|nr:DNA helicase PIF1, ATP-dependent [Metarhizium guizhouense ARSEF 977]
MSGDRQQQFYTYNAATNEQQDRLRMIRIPVQSFFNDNSQVLLETFSINTQINQHSRFPPADTTRGRYVTDDTIVVNTTRVRRRRHRCHRSNEDTEFPLARSRRRRAGTIFAEAEVRFRGMRKRFKDRWNKEFPDTPCAECATLLLPRNRKRRAFQHNHEYGITSVFNVPVTDDEPGGVILCEDCCKEPQAPIDCGQVPQCIASLPRRSTLFISPFKLDTNLGRTSGYNLHTTPYVYRTLSGVINTNPINERANMLYSGTLGAYLQSSSHRVDQHQNLEHLIHVRNWLLQRNPVFQRNDVRAHLQIDHPLPTAELPENSDERRPQTRPDLVMNPFQYDQETRNEHFRYYRLSAGAIQVPERHPPKPMLYRTDPDVEVLCFPHLYPYGKGQFVQGERRENGRSTYTRHMDTKRKLNSYNRAFRDDYYWAAWAYQEMEATRIFQNTNRLIHNKTRQAIDNRLPQHQLLQQSNYGSHSIISETLTHAIPGSIRTGEAYFLEKERLVNSMISGHGLPQLFITLTFNEGWEEFKNILRSISPSAMPSNHPWEGVQYYYERIHNLKSKFWKGKSNHAKFGILKELIERFEFQLRGAIHSHCLLWTEKSIVELLAYGFVRADIPDPEKEPELHSLVMKYQIHKCKDYICGGPGRYGKCSKGFPADVSRRTFHQPGNPRYTYARTEADVWVVPYNAQLLLIWEGHCNVQFVTSQGLASYITKYVTKNEPLSHVLVGDCTATQKHLLARRMGSMEIIVLCLGLDIFRCTSGSLYLPTSTPEMRSYSVRPANHILEHPADAYFPDAMEKYFARPRVPRFEVLTYFDYFAYYEITKTRIINRQGPREGWRDSLGYWVYQRKKPILIRTSYRRLCDGEVFFYVQLLYRYHWRSDDEIIANSATYRERLFELDPVLYDAALRGHADRVEHGNLYCEMVQRVARAAPPNVHDMVSEQLRQLNTMSVPGLADAASLTLKGEQYQCYSTVTQNISASRHQGCMFFVTGPGGTGKSFLLRALQYWCDKSRNPALLLAPTGIAARNIDGNTIHSALSVYSHRSAYHTGLFRFEDQKKKDIEKKTVLIIDEVSMVDGVLLDYLASLFAKLRRNNRPFGNMHVIVFGDLMQLPPVEGLKVFKASVWKLFHPIFLRQPHRQTNDKFFRILNKIRFGIIDDEVRCTLEERWRQYNPQYVMWNTTYLSSLRDEAAALNHAVLSGMPSENPIFVSKAEDFENGVRLQNLEHSKVFNKGTNFPSSVVCTVGAKVMFLTNSMLSERGISNGSIGVITNLLPDDEVEAAFPTKDGIQIMHLHKTSSYFQTNGVQYKRVQLPIINAFALTIHKVQGLSLPAVTVALNSNVFSDGQAYVALSRGKDLEQVYLTHCDLEAIKADPEAIAEYERLEAKAEQLNRPNSH